MASSRQRTRRPLRTAVRMLALLCGLALVAEQVHRGGDRVRAAGPRSEGAVFEAVFRQQVQEHLDVTERARRTVLCLAIDPGGAPQSPSRELMARLSSYEPSVRRAAECDPRPTGAVEAMTLRPAVVVTAGPIDWIAPDEAWVAVAYFRDARRSALRRYRVVRDHDGWVCLGPILFDGPA